jgi:multisubunit Na+/H+ antiporter MnhE subunit
VTRVGSWVLATALLTLVYALVLASFKRWDLALGAAASVALLFALRGVARPSPEREPGLLRRIVAFFPFALAVLVDVARGTWEVALVTLHLRPLDKPGIVEIPVGERTPIGVAVSTLCATLSPGEFLVEVDEERREILLHVIDASDPDAIRERHRRFYERYQRWVFP